MSVHVFVGPSGCGKTFFMRQYLLPTLLTVPTEATQLSPHDGYAALLIDDPPTTEFPDGQYVGPLYEDVAEWRRAEVRSRVARFRAATVRALCRAARDVGRVIICLDDMERALGNAQSGGSSAPPPEALEVVTRGRLSGCMIVGAVRRLGSLHTTVKANVERAYFGHLSSDADRREAAAMANVPIDALREAARPGVFLEWDRPRGVAALVIIENRRKITLRPL